MAKRSILDEVADLDPAQLAELISKARVERTTQLNAIARAKAKHARLTARRETIVRLYGEQLEKLDAEIAVQRQAAGIPETPAQDTQDG